jgi:hypothetical protein
MPQNLGRCLDRVSKWDADTDIVIVSSVEIAFRGTFCTKELADACVANKMGDVGHERGSRHKKTAGPSGQNVASESRNVENYNR